MSMDFKNSKIHLPLELSHSLFQLSKATDDRDEYFVAKLAEYFHRVVSAMDVGMLFEDKSSLSYASALS